MQNNHNNNNNNQIPPYRYPLQQQQQQQRQQRQQQQQQQPAPTGQHIPTTAYPNSTANPQAYPHPHPHPHPHLHPQQYVPHPSYAQQQPNNVIYSQQYVTHPQNPGYAGEEFASNGASLQALFIQSHNSSAYHQQHPSHQRSSPGSFSSLELSSAESTSSDPQSPLDYTHPAGSLFVQETAAAAYDQVGRALASWNAPTPPSTGPRPSMHTHSHSYPLGSTEQALDAQYNFHPALNMSASIQPASSSSQSSSKSSLIRTTGRSTSYSPYGTTSPPSAASLLSQSPDVTQVTPAKPFVCDICSTAFQRGHDLKRHKETHSDVKAHVCECGKAFTRKDALKRHVFIKNCGSQD